MNNALTVDTSQNTSVHSDRHVYITRTEHAAYPTSPPFHPPEQYLELAFLPAFTPDRENMVYPAVRRLLARMTQTEPGDSEWSPLSAHIAPGDTVVLKPNFIKEHHETKKDEWQQVITHGSVIRAVCDYVIAALKGDGKIIICDAPQTDSSFSAICDVSGTRAVVDWYATWSPVSIELIDLRKEEWHAKDDVIITRTHLPGDPAGYVDVNLGTRSLFNGIDSPHGFYGADYETKITKEHHHDDVHEYLLARTVMDADVVINLPKLKTHKKTGITCALKNLVGINGDKNWLPHYILGSPEEGGDQFPARTLKTRTERTLMTVMKKILYRSPSWVNHIFRPVKKIGKSFFGDTHSVVRSGNWHGNDTTWRMTVDLNTCFFYWQQLAEESSRKTPVKFPRRYIVIVDGIIAGEGEGPLAPDAVASNVLIGGCNPVAIDTVSAWLMGFDPYKIKMLVGAAEKNALPLIDYPLEAIKVEANKLEWTGTLEEIMTIETFHFTPHFGWTGAIEKAQ